MCQHPQKTSGKGPDVLFRELKLKGIDDELIHEALSSFRFRSGRGRGQACGKVLEKKKLSSKETKQAIEQHLVRKGFSFDVISAALQETDYETTMALREKRLRSKEKSNEEVRL
ncbi:RecX family transcriptional regulator [Bacillus licheniformis]|nr:RecX family transcriptional regulator [Bacillus licheniformis]